MSVNLSSRKKLLSDANKILKSLRESLESSKIHEQTPGVVTPQDILDFMTSIFVNNKSYRRKIFNYYNREVKSLLQKHQRIVKQHQAGNFNAGYTGFSDNYFDREGYSMEELLLSSPDELVAKPKFSADRTTVDILYSRSNGGRIYKDALNRAIFGEIVEPYFPELKNLIWLAFPSNRYRAGEIVFAKKFVLKTLKAKMTSSGKHWKPVIDKYNK